MTTLEELRPWLSDLQGGIVRAHGRTHAHHLFLSFPLSATRARTWLREFASTKISSGWEHLSDARLLDQSFRSVLLTYRGYERLGMPAPQSEAFRHDMRNRAEKLNDPPASKWSQGYQREDIHALVIIANDSRSALTRDVMSFQLEVADAGIDLVIDEPATQLFLEGKPIEHFGYADGISQPLIGGDLIHTRYYRHWDPSASRELLLAHEPGASGHFGSYLVFRKLEQNVARWRQHVEAISRRTNMDRELVGALAIGRFRDGQPVLFHGQPRSTGTTVNDFNYDHDAQGLGCPLNAHIRKANPRRARPQGSGELVPDRRIVRRGMTYGVRPDLHPQARGLPPPATGVGLLFMCYQASIEEQFEHIQAHWMNAPHHPMRGAGADPLAGREGAGLHSPPGKTVDFGDVIHLLGGGYFFSPSLTFLRSLP
ncbi:Dyp-type peroxidase [Pyxidicoccus sp. MSG2]|uniref:Dyp-type peroxidase n=1 Tax=Pyxidicoccus sp. MSG2 TaxID=2996790 RepID=UPI00226E3DF3|nr:Dyp-type peroxidase domain-containing protein [Pyxidicoccus sp. MSG2]MCY1021095.1 Dyp-type peroxidase [Pyxidicoccus sp. MSG2]